MKTSLKIFAGSAAALALALAGVVYAHPGGGMWGMGPGMGMGMGPGMGMGMGPGMGMGMGPGMGMGMGPGMGMGMGMGMWGMSEADVTAAATARAAQLKARLQITPAQENAWKAFENVLLQQVQAMQAIRAQMHAQAPGSAADWTAHREAMVKLHETNWAAQSAALKDLYAVLTPDQRAVLDRNPVGMGGPRAGRPFGPR